MNSLAELNFRIFQVAIFNQIVLNISLEYARNFTKKLQTINIFCNDNSEIGTNDTHHSDKMLSKVSSCLHNTIVNALNLPSNKGQS